MGDNEALDGQDVEPGEQQRSGLWFLNENGEKQTFQSEGFVRRIPGEEDRVQFRGSCILKDAPDRKLNVEGTATVAVVKDLQTGADVEQQVDAAAGQAPTAWELANADMEGSAIWPLTDESIAQVGEAIARGHIVVKRGGDAGPATTGVDEEEPAVPQASSDQDEEADQKGDQPKETASFEIDDMVAPPLDEDVEQRLNEAIARGHIVLRQRGDKQGTTDSSKAKRDLTDRDEEDRQDQPQQEEQIDPYAFTPMRRVLWYSDEEEDGEGSAEEAPRPSRGSPMAGREASPIDDQPGPSRVRIDIEEAFVPSESESTSTSTSRGVRSVDEESFGGEPAEGGYDKPAFPVKMVRDQLMDESYGAFEVKKRAAVYASAVVEMLIKRVFVLADGETRVVNHEDVQRAMLVQDDLLGELLKNVIIPKDPLPEP